MPAMSVVRSANDVDTAPAVALRMPERLPSEKLEANKFVEDATVAKSEVVVAFVVVARVMMLLDE
jgi:hypothetical protein